MQYPKWKYHPAKSARLVTDVREESALGAEWANSPAEFGIETAPAEEPDPVIAERKLKLVSVKATIPAQEESEGEFEARFFPPGSQGAAPLEAQVMPMKKKPGRKPKTESGGAA